MADYHKRYTFLSELFPKQFDSIPHIIIWTVVLLFDVVIVFLIGHLLGIPLPIGGTAWGRIGVLVYLAVAFVFFWLETFVYNKITE